MSLASRRRTGRRLLPAGVALVVAALTGCAADGGAPAVPGTAVATSGTSSGQSSTSGQSSAPVPGGGSTDGAAKGAPHGAGTPASGVTGGPAGTGITVSTPPFENGESSAYFSTPTGNIACSMTWTGPGYPVDVLCQIADRSWQAPAAPADCRAADGDVWGDTLQITDKGAALGCRRNGNGMRVQSFPGLGYDHAIRIDRTQCISRLTGITCTDETSGHGFMLSRQSYRLY